MTDTLISYRIDAPAPGVMRVHLRQRPMIALLVIVCVTLMGIPAGFAADLLAGSHPFANLNGKPALAQAIAMLGLAMLSIAGPAGLWLWPVRESLLLSQPDQRGWRITRNVFGLRRRVADTFSLEGVRGLFLRRGKAGEQVHLEPVLVDQHGEPHPLSFQSGLLKPGSKRADDYLAALSDYFGKPWPEAVADPAAWQQLMQKQKPRGKSPGMVAGKSRTQATKHEALPPLAESALASEPPPISMPLRVTLGLVGVFFGLVAVNNVLAVLSGLFSGRLVTSGSRFSHSTSVARVAEEPVWFSVNVAIEIFGVLLLASIAYGCLRVALRAPADRASHGPLDR